MTSPQLENGHARIANEIVEALAKTRISGEEMQCLWVILRKTYGWNKTEDWISLSQFVEMTGINKPNVIRALKKLIAKNIVVKKDNKEAVKYCFQKNYKKWNPLSKKITLSKKIISVVKKDNLPLSKKIPTKDTITKDNTTKDKILSWFDHVWKDYPCKTKRKEAERHFVASVKTEDDFNDITKALINYTDHLKATPWKSPQGGQTWFNNWKDWIDWKEPVSTGIRRTDDERISILRGN